MSILSLCVAPFLLVPGISGNDDPRWNPDTGAAAGNYPPHLLFDHQHLKLELDIPDIETSSFTATAKLTTTPIGSPRSELTLDARSPITFKSIAVNGQSATFTRSENRVSITLPTEFQPGQVLTVTMNYAAEKPYKDGCGLNWFKTRPGKEKAGAMVYSQGEADWNSLWFPCHDFPNDKLTTEIICTVDAAYEVVSNGRLVSKDPAGTRTTWHWLQDKPHASYLVMLAIGKWDVVDVASPDRPGLTFPVYGPLGSAENLKTLYKNTPAMVAYFEQLFDEPYPWDKYAQVIVRNFNWGGMENTSATTLAEYAARGDENSQDDLIAHELAHQWTGDLITCKSWEHIWLNEGWASFSEWMWQSHRDGPKAYRQAAMNARRKLSILPLEPLPVGIPMVSKLYNEPDDTFTKPEDPYTRGAFVLHMLKCRLGDEAFWKGTRLYFDRFKFKSAETDDFRICLEEASGQSLERFFDQWAKRPGMPTLKVTHTYDSEKKTIAITVTQTQHIDALNPAYGLRLPIYINTGSSEGTWVYIDTDQREVTQSFPLAQKPDNLKIDPNATLLAKFESDRDPAADRPD